MVGSCLAVCARLTATPMVAVSWGYTPRIKSLCDERGDQLDDAAAAVVPLRQALRRTAEVAERRGLVRRRLGGGDRKSTRLNSSHLVISYAVFCLKKKKMSQ